MESLDVDLRAFASEAWPGYDWRGAEIRVGAFHTVLIPAGRDVVLRAVIGNDFASRCDREADIIRTLSAAGLRIAVPKLLGGPMITDRFGAILISRLPGALREPDDLEPPPVEDYHRILTGLLLFVDRDRLRGLPPRRTWCGGSDWPQIVRSELLGLLPSASRSAAVERVEALLESEDDGPGFLCHGDFGPHNLLWEGDRPTGLIDLDHACLGEPAIDIAPLIGCHGVAKLRQLATADLLAKAMLHRATLSLQVAAAAHLAGATDLRDHALGNFTSRHRAGTLFDPDGLTPEDLFA